MFFCFNSSILPFRGMQWVHMHSGWNFSAGLTQVREISHCHLFDSNPKTTSNQRVVSVAWIIQFCFRCHKQDDILRPSLRSHLPNPKPDEMAMLRFPDNFSMCELSRGLQRAALQSSRGWNCQLDRSWSSFLIQVETQRTVAR